MKYVLVTFIVSVIFLAVGATCANAFVPSNAPNILESLEFLEKELEVDPGLKAMNGPGSTMSTATKEAIYRALGTVKAYEIETTGRSVAEGLLSKLAGGPDETQVNLFENDILDGLTSTAGTATEGSIAAGIMTSSPFLLASGATLLALNGKLWYETIETGENFLSTAILGPQQDTKALEEQERAEPVGVEGYMWARLWESSSGETACKPEHDLAGCLGASLAERGVTLPEWSSAPGIEDCTVESTHGCGGWNDPGFGGFSEMPFESYILLYKDTVNSKHYWGIGSAVLGALTKPFWSNGPLTGGNACAGVEGYPMVALSAGLPGGGRVGTTWFDERLNIETPYCYNVGIRRDVSRMHQQYTKKITKGEAEKLASEGKVVAKAKGNNPSTEEQLKLDIIRLRGQLEKARHRSIKQAVEHWTESGGSKAEPKHEEEGGLPPTAGHEEGEAPPLPGTIDVPTCGGSWTGVECQHHIEELGFESVKLEEIGFENADLGKMALNWLETKPAPGTELQPNDPVTVVENPSVLPSVIPAPESSGESGEEFKKQLEVAGWTNVSISTLPEVNIDPKVGPNGFSYSVPAVGSRAATKSTHVTVEQNPSNAPTPEIIKPITGPTLPGIKLPSFGVLCKGFPFGVPCWLASFVEGWSATSTAPEWGIENFELLGHKIKGSKVKLSMLEPIMERVRPAMLIFATVGLLLLFYKFAKGGSPPSGSGTVDPGATEGYEGMEGM